MLISVVYKCYMLFALLHEAFGFSKSFTISVSKRNTVHQKTKSLGFYLDGKHSNSGWRLAPKGTVSAVDEIISVKAAENETNEVRLSKFNEALCPFNSSAASDLLQDLNRLRESSQSADAVELFLNHLLLEGPDSKLPFWTKIRPIARFSKRARMASVRRTLDATTPPPNENDEAEELDATDILRRRRRALVSLLRTLAASPEIATNSKLPAILTIEKQARSYNTKDNLISRRPAGLETPDYDVIVKRSEIGYEIRQYKPYSVCSVAMNAPRPVDRERTDAKLSEAKTGGASAFGALAGYLFGKNKSEIAMKMTTPVLTNGQGSSKEMSFILPSEFWKDEKLSLAPQPLEGSGVKLQRKTNEERAVIMFGGYASRKEVEARKSKLFNTIAKQKDWEVTDPDSFALAQYNDPFTPPWKRLNEVSVAVRRKS